MLGHHFEQQVVISFCPRKGLKNENPEIESRSVKFSNFEKLFLRTNLSLCRDFQPPIHNLCCEIDKIVLNLTGEKSTSRPWNFKKRLKTSESA